MNKPFLPGERVRIRAIKDVGSARLLHGLTGQIMGHHPIAKGWYKIRLDPNEISHFADWSVPGSRLIPENGTESSPPLEHVITVVWP